MRVRHGQPQCDQKEAVLESVATMPPRPRLVRRRPVMQRIKAAIDPWDFFLWLSEEIETRDFGSKSLGSQLGLAFNFVFILARVYGSSSTGSDNDDVFNDSDSDSAGWLAYFVSSWTLFVLQVIPSY